MRYIKSFQNDAAIQAAIDNKTLGKPYVALNESAGTIDWDGKEETDYSKIYFTIDVISAGTVNLILRSGKNAQYSLDGETWEDNVSINAQPGDKIMYKGTNNALTGSTFSASTAYFNVYGNSMSLLYGDNFIGKTTIINTWGAFSSLFSRSKVIDVSNLVLPATTVYQYSYQNMFYGCTSLTQAPAILPATTLENRCYSGMFNGCTSLTQAPELPATTAVGYCYEYMFMGCTNLNYIKCLLKPSTTTVTSQTSNWVQGVSATGTFVKAANATKWTTGKSGIPSGWTVIEE